ncbi:TlpA family protein disulfide reductase [Niabella drilacis]|uniref:Thiol-disulfide isomerase or thioredoxin n=1 Tax=Niabella drilacis (strain DSM 25811 / CCM 8410 / CCUG 62505 / LMG 26954 / E90) TaxID=1285928 RepID=A0A1G6LP25_NIADE|nr:TlpA disulfide reductase family protein [Niabella drilacis]SDC44827.1 Thiol-disulfide isomerase or thioredoxin [Niabella drilacis]
MKNLLLSTFLFIALHSGAQSNLIISPKQPRAGDVINLIYTPGGDLTGTGKVPEAYVLKMGSSGQEMEDLVLKKKDGRYTAAIQTDTAQNLLVFGFAIDEKKDNNADSGYLVTLYDGNKVKKGAYASAAQFYNNIAEWKFGLKTDAGKARTAYEKEIALYPESREPLVVGYLFTLNRTDKEKAATTAQAEIEKTLKAGLKTEEDYTKIINLYGLLRLPQQQAFWGKLKKEKMPSGKLTQQDYYAKFNGETNLSKKEAVVDGVLKAAASQKDPDSYNSLVNSMQRQILTAYAAKKDWSNFKRYALLFRDEKNKINTYNSVAWKMQEDDGNDLAMAAALSKETIDYGRGDLKTPRDKKPKMQLKKEWMQQKENDYATYADTYGMILYKQGKYQQGLPYAREAALTISKGTNTDKNGTYAQLAEKALPAKKYKPELEKFVTEGNANDPVKEVLKRTYIKEHASETGYEAYITRLELGAKQKRMEELRKILKNDPAPQFALQDLSGKKITLEELKGKVVVVDFWATWCGPCRASFPAMQKMVEKYKDNPAVQFLFVDTWETVDDKQKNATDFIAKNKYDFHVLMDNESKVVAQFNVTGIPTKFVIGKDGNIKFQSIGFGGDEQLQKELEAMIELAN